MNEKNEPEAARNPVDIEARVAAHPFLLGLSAHHIRLLADAAIATHFKAAEMIFRTGDIANRFYLIESGTVVLEGPVLDREAVIIDTISGGDLLGWSWLFPPCGWQFDARATEETSALFFYGTILRQYCDEDLTLGHELFKRMSKVMVRRLQAARTKLIEAIKENGSKEG